VPAGDEEERPNRRSLAEERRGERRPVAEPYGDILAEGKVGLGIGEVLDVNSSGVDDSSPSHPATLDWIREPNDFRFHVAVTSGHPELISFDEQECSVRGLAEPAGVLD
jgi:hypothetical protein